MNRHIKKSHYHVVLTRMQTVLCRTGIYKVAITQLARKIRVDISQFQLAYSMHIWVCFWKIDKILEKDEYNKRRSSGATTSKTAKCLTTRYVCSADME